MELKLKLITVLAILCVTLFLSSAAGHAAFVNFTSPIENMQVIKQIEASQQAKTLPVSIDAIVVLPTKDLNKTRETVNFIRKNGGVVSIVYVPNTLVVLKLPKSLENKIVSKFGAKVFRDQTKLADLKKISKIGANILSAKLSGVKYAPSTEPFKDTVLTSSDAPTRGSAKLSPPGSSGYPPPPSSSYTSYYMIGDVFVSVVLMESNGSIDTNLENWTQAEEDTIDANIAGAFNWWVSHSVDYNVSYPLTFWTYPNHYKIGTSYEPAQRPISDHGLWVQEALNNLGVPPDSSYIVRTRSYDNILRSNNSADWAFTIFAVDNSQNLSALWSSYAYIGGPYTAVKDNAGPTVHEMGHIFWALDQYQGGFGCTSPSSCPQTSGILHVENQNCQYSCASNVNSIMRGMGTLLDYYAAGQIGWRDLNTNNVTDSIDYSYNSADSDTDGDGTIDYWDTDDDNDGVIDNVDACPKSAGFPIYNGCSPPAVTVDANATVINVGDTIRISANASDNFKVMSLELYLDSVNTGWTCVGLGTASASCYKDLSYGSAGSHTFYATAKDDNNVTRDPPTGEKTFTVLPDSTDPTVTVSASPNPADIGQTITITANANDNFNLAEINIIVDSVVAKTCTVSGKSASCSYQTSYSTAGTHNYYANVTDSSGNFGRDPASGENNFIVLPDTINPTISITGPTGKVNIGQVISINASASDNVQVSWIAVYVDSSVAKNCTILAKSGSCVYSTSYPSAGAHNYYAVTSDSSGNTAQTAIQNFDVADMVNPTVIVSAPASVLIGQVITITANATDDINLAEIKIVVDSATAKTCSISGKSATCSYQTSYSTAGTHAYHAEVKDAANNLGRDPSSGEKSFSVIDNISPTVSISASPSSAVVGQFIKFNATASDNSQVKEIRVYTDLGLKKTCTINKQSGNCVYEGFFTFDGMHNYYAVAIDDSGNSVQSTQQNMMISLDSTAPWLGASYSPWPTRAGQKITISAHSDDNAQVKEIKLYVNSDTPTKTCTIQAQKGDCNYEFTPSGPGFFYYYAVAIDYSGNSVQSIPGGGVIGS
jgi:hypothetical protein